jgi:hypothetical protein
VLTLIPTRILFISPDCVFSFVVWYDRNTILLILRFLFIFNISIQSFH